MTEHSDTPGRIADRFVPLKENNSTTFIARCKIVASMVKLNSRDDISWLENRVSVTSLRCIPTSAKQSPLHHEQLVSWK